MKLEMYECLGCGKREKREAGKAQWHGCHPATFRMMSVKVKRVSDSLLRKMGIK